jgi:hypothetical protein
MRLQQQNPVPICPGLRLWQFGTGFWSVRNSFPAKSGIKPARKPGPGTGSTTEQPELKRPPFLMAPHEGRSNVCPQPSCAEGQKTYCPPDPGRNRPQIIDLQRNMAVRTSPGPPRGRADKNKNKSVLKSTRPLASYVNTAGGPRGGVEGRQPPQPGGSGGREPPRRRKTILNTGRRPAT